MENQFSCYTEGKKKLKLLNEEVSSSEIFVFFNEEIMILTRNDILWHTIFVVLLYTKKEEKDSFSVSLDNGEKH